MVNGAVYRAITYKDATMSNAPRFSFLRLLVLVCLRLDDWALTVLRYLMT
jgi:hypothetical protein